MTRAGVLLAPRIRPLGWALIALRLLAMMVLLLVCLPLHLVWRLFGLGRWWPRAFLAGIGLIAGLHVRVDGRPSRGALFLANHVSWLDIPALAQVNGSAFVAHDGLSAFPFLKWLCDMNDTVYIARLRRHSVAEQVEQVRAAMSERGVLTLFPEGTTSEGTGLLPFKSALLSALDPLPAGLVVQPVGLLYDDAKDIAWVGEEHGLDNFKRILARLRPIGLTIRFLPPLSGDELGNRKAVAAAAQSAVGRLF